MLTRLRRKLEQLRTLPARWGDTLELVAQNTSDLCTRVETLTRELVQLKRSPRNAQLLLLWQGDRDRPCCAAIGFNVAEQRHVVFEHIYFPVPAGAWLVAIGCTMHTVCVGNDLQTATMAAKLRVVRLTDAIELGVHLRAQVEPEEVG